MAVIPASDTITILVAPLLTKLNKPTALEVQKLQSGRIRTSHSSPWPVVLTSHTERVWPAQIVMPGQL